MKNKFKLIVIMGTVILLFASCGNNEELSSLQKNKELLERFKIMEEENRSLNREKEILEDEIIFIKNTLKNSNNIAFTKDSIYIKSEEYYFESEKNINQAKVVSNIMQFSKSGSSKTIIQRDDIISFLPSYDNKYISLICGADNRVFEISIYEHEGDKVCSFGIERFLEKGFLTGGESLSFTDYSKNNKYIYGIVHAPLDVCGFWSIDLNNRELKVYKYDDYNEFEALQKEYPEFGED